MVDMALRREPPAAVRRLLAEEVGFGCPVDGCGSPYLTWHHFDPPWSERHQHDPRGMVALCRDHHPEADAGAFTLEELREFKREGRDRSQALGARFNWMREELLAVVGGNFYLDTHIAVRVQDAPVVWFNRDPSGQLLVNLQMLSTSGKPRLLMLDNFWLTEGSDEREIVCPPSGRLVSVKYPNGDRLKVEFREVASVEDFDRRYPPPELPADLKRDLEAHGITPPDLSRTNADAVQRYGVEFPMATVEITMDIAGTDIRLGPRRSEIGPGVIAGSWVGGCEVGIQIGEPSGDAPHPPTEKAA
jgi:hypothetical protein